MQPQHSNYSPFVPFLCPKCGGLVGIAVMKAREDDHDAVTYRCNVCAAEAPRTYKRERDR